MIVLNIGVFFACLVAAFLTGYIVGKRKKKSE